MSKGADVMFWPYVLPLFCALIGLLVWVHSGKDKGGRGVLVPEYGPPQNLSPAEVGVIYDFAADDREVTATLVDLAIRGFIVIHKLERKHLFGTSSAYEFELSNDDVLHLKNHEKALLNGLFGVVGAKYTAKIQAELKNPVAKLKALTLYPAGRKSLLGSRVSIDQIQPYFFRYVSDAKQQLYNNLTSDGYFNGNPLLSGLGMTTLGVICACVSFFFQRPGMYSVLLSGLLLIFFGISMRSRARKGTIAKESIEGFLEYLQLVEEDRIKTLEGPDTSQQKEGVIQFYETYLPYAIALGIENEWSKKFKSAYHEPASWMGNDSRSAVLSLKTSVSDTLSSKELRELL